MQLYDICGQSTPVESDKSTLSYLYFRKSDMRVKFRDVLNRLVAVAGSINLWENAGYG